MAERLTFQAARTATDEEIAVAAQADARHFDRLYERYADRIYAYALSRTRSPEMADDLVGDTMIAALENLHRFDPGRGSFSTWILPSPAAGSPTSSALTTASGATSQPVGDRTRRPST